jgi:hypothetical protein
MSPLEIHETLQTVEDEINAFEDQQLDLIAAQSAGNSLRTYLSNPNTSYEMMANLPDFIRASNLKDNPRAFARWMAAMNGEAPMSAVYDGGPVQEIAEKYLVWDRQRRAQADAENMALGGGGEKPQAAPTGPPKNYMEEVMARKQGRESLAVEIGQLEKDLGAGAWRYQTKGKKFDALDAFRRDLAKSPEAFEDEAAYNSLMQKHGLDPNDAEAAEAAANAASMREADFGKFAAQIEDGRAQRKEDSAKVKALKESGASTPELYRLVEEAADDPSGELWRSLPAGAEPFKRFFADPTTKRKAPSAMEALTSQNPKL